MPPGRRRKSPVLVLYKLKILFVCAKWSGSLFAKIHPTNNFDRPANSVSKFIPSPLRLLELTITLSGVSSATHPRGVFSSSSMLFPPIDSSYMPILIPFSDIECAFPSREEDSEDEPLLDAKGNPIPKEPIPPRSRITLAGLLNVPDYSVASEEGRLTFATRLSVPVAWISSGKEEYSFIQGWVLQQDVESIGISTRNAGLKPLVQTKPEATVHNVYNGVRLLEGYPTAIFYSRRGRESGWRKRVHRAWMRYMQYAKELQTQREVRRQIEGMPTGASMYKSRTSFLSLLSHPAIVSTLHRQMVCCWTLDAWRNRFRSEERMDCPRKADLRGRDGRRERGGSVKTDKMGQVSPPKNESKLKGPNAAQSSQ
ncbi:hypothetical protein B0H13DRAFT_1900589 [Mycena leptocephala]|nr:hypothetical protein B0H13DRAFT_1900589 [Mycena leptocephala]